ncbi:MAG: hypothetical protein MSA26_13185 [Lachnospiraceae bacterium]|nr:hypothetical protein [Lachnospiraceae bacterium]
MNKKAVGTGVACGVCLGTTIIAYAIMSLFFTKSETSKLSKKTVFQFDLSTDMEATKVGPGDSFDVKPVIYNDATEEMYVFIQVDMPTTADGILYSFDVDDEWCVVSEDDGTVVYAYGSTEMTILAPGDSTSALTNQMTMKSISNAEYAAIDDINITITGYAMGTEDMSTNPVDAWNECKTIGDIQ